LGSLVSCLFLLSCARELKTDDELTLAPEDFEQKIEDIVVPEKVSEVETAQTESVKKPISAKPRVAAKTPTPSVPTAKEGLATKWPYGQGERLRLALRWGVIEGGLINMETRAPQIIDGEKVLHYYAEVKSSKMLNLVYRIDNSIQSWVRLKDHLPVRQEIVQKESGRWGRRVVVFAPEAKQARFYEHITNKDGRVSENRKSDEMSEGALDIFSALYFYRFVDAEKKNFSFPIHDKHKNWTAQLEFQDIETVRVPAGTFKTRRYKLLPVLAGHLEPRGDVDLWISDDEKRHIVQFRARLRVGSVTGELIEYQEGEPLSYESPRLSTPVVWE
jgi:hypothetical protein